MVEKINSKLSKKVFFIVDDDNQNGATIIRGLEQGGNKVFVIQNCVDLFQRVKEFHPDIILLDLQLSDLDGYRLCGRLKQQSDTQNIPVILINLPANKQSIKDALEAGADDYISCPVHFDEVICRVNTQLELYTLRNNFNEKKNRQINDLKKVNKQICEDLNDCCSEQNDLASSEQQFRHLTEGSPDFVARYDDKCRRTYINPRLAQLLGGKASGVIGFAPIEFMPNDPQSAAYQARLQEVLDTGQASDFEYRLQDNSRDERRHNIRFVAERDAQGQIVGVRAIGRDVTGLRAAGRQNVLLEAMAENSEDVMIFAHTLDVKAGLPLQYFNPCLARHLGYTDAEMNRLRVSDFSEVNSDKLVDYMDILRRDKAVRIETEHVRKGGERVPVEVILSYLLLNGEELAVGYCLDIRERKAADQRVLENERALRSSERQFRTLAENTPDNIVRYDKYCRVVYANPQIESLMCRSFGSMIGMTPTELTPGEEGAKRYQQAIERVLQTGKQESVELEVVFLGKAPQINQIVIVAELRSDGEIRGALAIGRDITTLKETEKRLEESRTQLQALTQRREAGQKDERKRIAQELHDDLGQYLTALNLQVSALQIRFGKEDEILSRSIEHIVTLIDGMKKSLRNISQRLRPEALNMGLKAALESLADDILSQCDIDYSMGLDFDVGDICEVGTVVAYRVTQESLTNIVRHAGAKNVSISLERKNENFVLIINDDGKGFDVSEDKPRSFGLLGMSERLQAIGGELKVISKPQLGTTVTASIPSLQAGAKND